MSDPLEPFPTEGKFPSVDEFREYVGRSLVEIGVSAGKISKAMPGQTNPNLVRDIETGKAANPTGKTMKAVFDTIEGFRQLALQDQQGPSE